MKIVPRPLDVTYSEGEFVFNKNTAFPGNEMLKNELFFLDFEDDKPNRIIIKYGDIEYDYILDINNEITITANDEKGVFYAVMSLKQLIFEYYNEGLSNIPYMAIKDKAKMEYRSYMLDVCRHYFNLETIKNVVDCLAYAKINKLHLHLTDDQGFRIESKVYPELHKKGSVRKQTCGDGKEVSGYFTQEEIKDLIKYCDERFIEVIPEFDLPGHTATYIAAYPELSCFNSKIDTMEWFGIHKYVLCLGKEEVYKFIENLLTEFAALFPSKYIHLGGDEAPSTAWQMCPKCQELYKKSGVKNYLEFQLLFTNRIVDIVKKLGKKPIMWNEAFTGGMNKDAIMQYWMEAPGRPKVAKKQIQSGQKTVISKTMVHYLDYPHYISPMKKIYEYNPAKHGIKNTSNVLGYEAPLWTEYVTTTEELFKHTFPRIFALAENTWSGLGGSYNDFKNNRLINLLGILMAYGYEFEELALVDSKGIKNLKANIKFFKSFTGGSLSLKRKAEEMENIKRDAENCKV